MVIAEVAVKAVADQITAVAKQAFSGAGDVVELRYGDCGSECDGVHHTLHVRADGVNFVFYFEGIGVHKVEADMDVGYGDGRPRPFPTLLEFLKMMSLCEGRAA